MKNILLISSIYPIPSPDNEGTPVCHYFARDWKKLGYHVRVIHTQSVYPFFFYWIAKFFKAIIAAKTGAVVYTKKDKTISTYKMDDVDVMRIPVLKLIPHRKYVKQSIKKVINVIISSNQENDFIPDFILGHFPNPQFEIIANLKQCYPNAKSVLVMHGDIGIMRSVYEDRIKELYPFIDIWGFRSRSVFNEFESVFGKCQKSFLCYSGIPQSYIADKNRHEFQENNITKFIYIGTLIERKYPVAIIDAVYKIYQNKPFNITYIGVGAMQNEIRRKVMNYHVEGKIDMMGKVARDEIKNYLDDAECMIMISRGEAFGLVYLEAMARGCITIASRNEGFDGIIIDGYNGFLCEAGNSDELAEIIHRINHLSAEERQVISDNAIQTAKKLTDIKVAQKYIDSVKNL